MVVFWLKLGDDKLEYYYNLNFRWGDRIVLMVITTSLLALIMGIWVDLSLSYGLLAATFGVMLVHSYLSRGLSRAYYARKRDRLLGGMEESIKENYKDKA